LLNEFHFINNYVSASSLAPFLFSPWCFLFQCQVLKGRKEIQARKGWFILLVDANLVTRPGEPGTPPEIPTPPAGRIGMQACWNEMSRLMERATSLKSQFSIVLAASIFPVF